MRCGADNKGERCLIPFYCIFMHDYRTRKKYICIGSDTIAQD